MTTDAPVHSPLSPDCARALLEGRWHDPFAVLGPHQNKDRWTITALIPGAERAEALGGPMGGLRAELTRLDPGGLFEGEVPAGLACGPYRLRAERGDAMWEFEDPYRFGPVLGELDEHLIAEGAHRRLWERLGAHPMTHEGVEGVHFAVWAPAAKRVSLVGDFNVWDGRRNVMRARGGTGVWEIFMPGMHVGAVYKYEIVGQDGNVQPLKADPVGFGSEHPPATASVVRDLRGYDWRDADWMEAREARNRRDTPISIYEAHLGSWKRVPEEGNRPLSYLELAERLVPYVSDMGFTHIELMPITEHPFDGSWGYQPIGLFAPTIRHGTPDEFRQFVEACHRAGLGLILDWVPAHFPTDAHGLAQFDGTALYEHADPREGFHHDWNTLIYNYGRREVSNFLVASALYWLDEYHIDGLRVDAVASMLYRDYSRNDGEWIPNQFGGRENLEAIEFMRRANALAYEENSGVMMVAEESTAFPGVSAPVDAGGLGFGYKWNMGWMNDTLDYISRDPIHRRHHHHQMTFGLHYGFTENFVLPISHDEVVHGKGSMISKMPGEGDDKFAHLRAYYGFMWGHPGKKLLFQGQEFAQGVEWSHDVSLDWHLLDRPQHRGMRDWVRDLNRVYRDTPALHRRDCEGSGFCWLELNADDISVYAWMRLGEEGDAPVIVACNFTPVDRPGFRVGAPKGGAWREILNSDGAQYGGRGHAQPEPIEAERKHWNHQDWSFELHLPGLSTVMFRAES